MLKVLWLHEMSPLIGKNDDFWGLVQRQIIWK